MNPPRTNPVDKAHSAKSPRPRAVALPKVMVGRLAPRAPWILTTGNYLAAQGHALSQSRAAAARAPKQGKGSVISRRRVTTSSKCPRP
jgi:hypothetical protein